MPLLEQQRIVAILDEAFAAIAKAKANAQQNLQNAKELFEGYLQVVFENKGEGWEEKTIDKVCSEIFAGGDAPKGNFSEEETEKYTILIYVQIPVMLTHNSGMLTHPPQWLISTRAFCVVKDR